MGCCCSDTCKANPQKLEFGLIDWLKALISWIRSYRKTYEVEPGLYYTGDKYEIRAPMLVTCNYHMTVFLLWRVLKGREVRILVLNTHGINVWCSSGKGRFSAQEIIKQLARYDQQDLTNGPSLEIILPKLSLSGVKLSELRKANIKLVIGPIYAQNLPEFLDGDVSDCDEEHYKFNLRNRVFTLLPSFIQFSKYILSAVALLFIINLIFKTSFWWQILPVSLSIPILYIILFPILPGRYFSIKGVSLFLMQILILFLLIRSSYLEMPGFIIAFHLIFYLATNIFFSLYYTGNSGVSNYTMVKKEIIAFLPVTFILYSGAFILLIIYGVMG
ncbi:MAG: hypothetical protein K9N06_11190 [Candidatus Cloacimonetes bacterium]|nr:hypothetical protein [Candidatus Cloacimonadota bacterium]